MELNWVDFIAIAQMLIISIIPLVISAFAIFHEVSKKNPHPKSSKSKHILHTQSQPTLFHTPSTKMVRVVCHLVFRREQSIPTGTIYTQTMIIAAATRLSYSRWNAVEYMSRCFLNATNSRFAGKLLFVHALALSFVGVQSHSAFAVLLILCIRNIFLQLHLMRTDCR